MPDYEVYIARGGAQLAEEARAAEAAPSPYTIEVRFLGGLSQAQKNAFRAAADRWTRAIVGDLLSVRVDGEVIDDILILAQGIPIDGPGRILGQAGPTHLRPGNAGSAAFLPAKGRMSFDTADLAQMEANGTLNDVIVHEMGHVIGVGTVWTLKNVLEGASGSNPVFVGRAATAAYTALKGGGRPTPVPVENQGGPGTRNSHWREIIFDNELMTGFVDTPPPNPMSTVTIASLQDLGYQVNMGAAEPYQLPNTLEVAESGKALSAEMLAGEEMVLPSVPIVLPESSLQ